MNRFNFNLWKWCQSNVPIIGQVGGGRPVELKTDLFAGLMVAVLLIPQAMAYAMLAGMPPIYGLYASVTPLIFYALFASSRQLSVGPVAISALLIISGVSKIAQPGSDTYIQLVILLGLLIGLVQLIMGLSKMGFLVNFISHPVIAGFTSAAALIIILSQMQVIFGSSSSVGGTFLNNLLATGSNMGSGHSHSLFIGLAALTLILGIKQINKRIPTGLLVIIAGIFFSNWFEWENMGIEVVGAIPAGLPQFTRWDIDTESIVQLLPTVLTVTLIGIVESIGIAKAIESKQKSFAVIPDREMIALGISKIAGSLLQAMPSSGSFSRTALNADAGARSQLSSMFTALFVVITLLFLTPLFYHLPTPVLAAIIVAAVIRLVDYRELARLWKIHKPDFWMMASTFVGTLAFGIETGVFLGVALSILAVIYRSSKPRLTVLGQVPGTTHFRNLERFDALDTSTDKLVVRFEEKLYFGNALYFKEKVLRILSNAPDVKYVIIEAGVVHSIDSTGIDILEDLDRLLAGRGIQLHLSGVIGPVRDILYKADLLKDPDRHHMSLHTAVTEIERLKSEDAESRRGGHIAMQTNVKRN